MSELMLPRLSELPPQLRGEALCTRSYDFQTRIFAERTGCHCYRSCHRSCGQRRPVQYSLTFKGKKFEEHARRSSVTPIHCLRSEYGRPTANLYKANQRRRLCIASILPLCAEVRILHGAPHSSRLWRGQIKTTNQGSNRF